MWILNDIILATSIKWHPKNLEAARIRQQRVKKRLRLKLIGSTFGVKYYKYNLILKS